MRKALVVGINNYDRMNSLRGCTSDAKNISEVLRRNGDGSKNFDVKLMVTNDKKKSIKKNELEDQIIELFKTKSDAVLYFSGHGHLDETGGYLITTECTRGNNGVSMDTILKTANTSKAKNKIIILDCCHSGYAGSDFHADNSLLSKGMTILTAATANQYAVEINGSGLFTSLLVDALNGSAADLMGKITPASIYAHIDQSLGPWQQRPLFKANTENFVSIRDMEPSVKLEEIKRITSFFKGKGSKCKLNPSFEPESSHPNPVNTEKFAVLQRYVSVGLVLPKGASKPHMYHAAMESKYCVLTPLGQHYWKLVKNNRI
jgi:hypothetical protein